MLYLFNPLLLVGNTRSSLFREVSPQLGPLISINEEDRNYCSEKEATKSTSSTQFEVLNESKRAAPNIVHSDCAAMVIGVLALGNGV